CQQNNEDPYTF
nr:immunoglobulin light chain junction region [Mus musculus]NSL97122.1 immunoglobulin light chain junction region [Mus musculus]NSL97392.1 immunoglobulin light chain junction region [Mus musculus]NSL97448.1 immunoglobulin light chain junction region [Mus musculus]NSL97866.1 immunoglobulin light chain junction region [Mus musculus]